MNPDPNTPMMASEWVLVMHDALLRYFPADREAVLRLRTEWAEDFTYPGQCSYPLYVRDHGQPEWYMLLRLQHFEGIQHCRAVYLRNYLSEPQTSKTQPWEEIT